MGILAAGCVLEARESLPQIKPQKPLWDYSTQIRGNSIAGTNPGHSVLGFQAQERGIGCGGCLLHHPCPPPRAILTHDQAPRLSCISGSLSTFRPSLVLTWPWLIPAMSCLPKEKGGHTPRPCHFPVPFPAQFPLLLPLVLGWVLTGAPFHCSSVPCSWDRATRHTVACRKQQGPGPGLVVVASPALAYGSWVGRWSSARPCHVHSGRMWASSYAGSAQPQFAEHP